MGTRLGPPEVTRQSNRIVILIVITRADYGGAQRHVYDLVSSLRAHYDFLVAVGTEGWLVDSLSAIGIPTISLNHLVREIRPWQDILGTGEILRALNAHRPTIVHTHSSKAGVLARLAAYIMRIPAIHTDHGWPVHGSKASRTIAVTLD